jgi:hypothetical protein
MLTGQIGLRRHGTTPIAEGIEWATDSQTHHVLAAVSETHVFSAEPGGARIRPMTDYPSIDWFRLKLTEAQRQAIVNAAHARVGLPYNYAIYPPLLFQKVTGHKVDGWVADWLSKRPNINCSQGVDDIYTAAGFRLFPSISEIVTPGDFERVAIHYGFL